MLFQLVAIAFVSGAPDVEVITRRLSAEACTGAIEQIQSLAGPDEDWPLASVLACIPDNVDF